MGNTARKIPDSSIDELEKIRELLIGNQMRQIDEQLLSIKKAIGSLDQDNAAKILQLQKTHQEKMDALVRSFEKQREDDRSAYAAALSQAADALQKPNR